MCVPPPVLPVDGAAHESHTGGGTHISPTASSTLGGPTPTENSPQAAVKKQFYGTVNLDPVKAKMDFAQIYDEIVEQFTSRLGVDVKISIEIQATSNKGFDESLQRTIKENSNVLRFSGAEFETE